MTLLLSAALLALCFCTFGFDNLTPGTPGSADVVIDRQGYALGYSEKHEQAAWVQYKLTAAEVQSAAAERTNAFAFDAAVPTGSAWPNDYTRSGYDRGHLAPAADMAFSSQTMADSFYMSNMSPQRPAFNRGVWRRLEMQVRAFALAEGEIYVVTGPVLPAEKTITIGGSGVTVPASFYKVVYAPRAEKMIAFIVPNDGSSATLQSFAVTVRAVELATGLNFFSALPAEKQAVLENTITVSAWDWKPP